MIFGDFVRVVGRTLGKGIEKAGDFLGLEKISSAGRKIQDACAKDIAKERSYDKETSEINTTERLNEILVSFSAGYFEHATFLENQCIKTVGDYYDQIIQLLEKTVVSQATSVNIKSLKRNKEKIKKDITGSIKDPLAKRVSLDNRECLNILKMDAGDEKARAMTDFTQKVIREALDNLAKNVRESLNENIEDVSEWLMGISEEQEIELSRAKEYFDNLCEKDLLETSEREKSCVKPLLVLDAVDIVAEIL